MKEITNEQKQVFISALLGDGSLKNGKASFNCMYKEYMKLKSDLLDNLSLGPISELNQGYKKGSLIVRLTSKKNEYCKKLEKESLKEAVKYIDELGLALWFLDDGSLHKKNRFYNINTHSFSREDEENVLIPKLNEFGIYPSILTETKKDGRVFSYLYVDKWSGAAIMSKMIRKVVPNCYRYKLLPKNIEDALYETCKDESFKKLDTSNAFAKWKYFREKYKIKKMDDLLEHNTKGIKMSYDKMHKLFKDTFGEKDVIFCMYEDLDDGNDTVIPEVNFLDPNPIVKGSYFLSFNNWNLKGGFYKEEGRSLTWQNLVDKVHEYGDKHHIFLEHIEINNNNEISVFLGS